LQVMGVKSISMILFVLLIFMSSAIALSDSGAAAKSLISPTHISHDFKNIKTSPVKNMDAQIMGGSVVNITSMDPPNYLFYNNQSMQSFILTLTTNVPATCYATGDNTTLVGDRVMFDITGGTTHQMTFTDFKDGWMYWSYIICQDSQNTLSEEIFYMWGTDYSAPTMTLIQKPEYTITENKQQTIEANFSDEGLGFFESQPCFYCIGPIRSCANHSTWNMTQNTFILNESGWYLNGTCSQSFNTADYSNGQYEFGIGIADIADNKVTQTGNFTISRPPTLVLDNYSVNTTTTFDRDVVKIYANWAILNLTNNTNITCRLYSNNQEVQTMNSRNGSCSFNYVMGQKDYPYTEMYVKATAIDGYESSSPSFNITMNPCGMNLTSNFTLYDDMNCSGGYALYDQKSDMTIDCNGHTISAGKTNMTGIFISPFILYTPQNLTLKGCRIVNFSRALSDKPQYTVLEMDIYNTTFENDSIVIEHWGRLDLYFTDVNIIRSNPAINTLVNATFIVNTYSRIENTNISLSFLSKILLNSGTLEIINSTIYIGGQLLNISGNITAADLVGTLSFSNYSVDSPVGHDGQRITISTQWIKKYNPLTPGNSSISCKLYSGTTELQTIYPTNLSCSFYYTMYQRDYPYKEFYVKAISTDGYEAVSPIINLTLDPCGMNLTSNFTLLNDMNCSGGYAFYDNKNDTTIDCNGHTINGHTILGTTNMPVVYVSYPIPWYSQNLTLKNCHIINFDKVVISSYGVVLNLTIYNTTIENDSAIIENHAYALNVYFTDVSILQNNPVVNTLANATLVVNNYSLIQNTNISLSKIMLNSGTLEIINSTIYVSGQLLNISGNITGIDMPILYFYNGTAQMLNSKYKAIFSLVSNYSGNVSDLNNSNTSFKAAMIFGWKNISDIVGGQHVFKAFDISLVNLSIVSGNNITPVLNSTYMLINYNHSELSSRNLDESTLKIYYYNETSGSWELVPVQGIDTQNDFIWFSTNHFSTYGVMASEIPPVVVPPAPSGGSGSGGGGGGGGGGGAAFGSSDILFNLSVDGSTYTPDKNQKLLFNYGSVNHTMHISTIGASDVLLNIDDTILNVSINQSVKYTLDSESILDLKLLKLYGKSSAGIFVKLDKTEQIVKPVTTTISSSNTTSTTNNSTTAGNAITGNVVSDQSSGKIGTVWIIAFVVFVVVLAGIIFYLSKRHKHHHRHR